MEPTARSWVPPWRRVHGVRIGSPQRNDYWPRLTLFTSRYLGPEDRHATTHHIVRLQDSSGIRVLFPTPKPWVHQLQGRLPLDTEPWRLPAPPPDLQIELPEPPPAVRAAGRAPWADSSLGWVVGIVLLALFVLLVRAIEKCLDRRLFKNMRRGADEWPTPNVLATSHQNTAPSRLLTSEPEADPPPPYSECLSPKPQCEDPPPPYSDCYVAFVNPKDGVPSAHIMMRGENDNVATSAGENAGGNIGSNANQSQQNSSPNAADSETVCTNVVPNSTVTHVNTSQGDSDASGNVGPFRANVERDVEANADTPTELVGVHIGTNTGNDSNVDCAILNENPRI